VNRKYIVLLGFLIVGCLITFRLWRQFVARRRMLTTIKSMAETGRNEINGHPVEYWLKILNQDAHQPLIANDTIVLIYQGQEFFFVDGRIAYTIQSRYNWTCNLKEACFLIAIGESAARLLSENEQVFRLIMGSEKLAAYSIFRRSAFTEMLMAGK